MESEEDPDRGDEDDRSHGDSRVPIHADGVPVCTQVVPYVEQDRVKPKPPTAV